MEICRGCGSRNIEFLSNLQPYVEYSWKFKIYECKECCCRFSDRDDSKNYHEVLHKIAQSPYQFHYTYAKKVHVNLHDKKYCETLLRKRIVISHVLDSLKTLDKDARVLEVGCSTGYVTAYLRSIGFSNAIGVDISHAAISFAQDMFGAFYYKEVPDSDRFDVIFHSGLIGCVANPQEFLHYYIGMLKDGGEMLFNAPNVQSPKELNELWVDTPPPDLVTLFDTKFFYKYLGLDSSFFVDVKTKSSFVLSQQKYKAKFLQKSYTNYPISFTKEARSYTFFDRIFYKFSRFLYKKGWLKEYQDEYGLIVSIKSL